MAEIEHHPRPLLQHIQIETAVAQKSNALFQRAALFVGAIKVGLCLRQTLVDLNPGDHTAVALYRVIDKIPRYACAKQLTKYLARAAPEFAT